MAAVLVAGLSFAQGAGKRDNRMVQDLGLNQDQRTQMQSIMKEQHQAMSDARKNNASKADRQALRMKTHDRVAGVLNPEQLQKFEASAKHRKGTRKPKA